MNRIFPKLLRIILYQMDVIFGDPEANLVKIQETLNELAVTPKSIIILPELFLTGYHAASINEVAHDPNYIEKLQTLVLDYDIRLFGSIPMEIEGAIYNTAIFLTPEGIIAKYQKSHLFGPMGEKSLFSEGRAITTFSLDGLELGMSICYDLRFPELYQKMARKGAVVQLLCAEWPITRVDHFRVLSRARAIETQSFVIALNRVGNDPDYQYGGHSAVYDPFGKVVAEIASDNEAIIECELDLERVDEFRNKFNVLNDKWVDNS